MSLRGMTRPATDAAHRGTTRFNARSDYASLKVTVISRVTRLTTEGYREGARFNDAGSDTSFLVTEMSRKNGDKNVRVIRGSAASDSGLYTYGI